MQVTNKQSLKASSNSNHTPIAAENKPKAIEPMSLHQIYRGQRLVSKQLSTVMAVTGKPIEPERVSLPQLMPLAIEQH